MATIIKTKLSKIVGLKKEDFDAYIEAKQIKIQKARLIPVLKTGDEGALTSIFLSTVKLVKEFRDTIFKELKLSRSGKAYYYTEAEFPDYCKDRVDGLIIIVTKGVITDAAFFEMKSKNSTIELPQIEKYVALAKALKITKLVTVSNEFVSDPSHSPINLKVHKGFIMTHFSWTYLITMGQLLLFKNDTNIEDEDQVEIMREALYYFDNPLSGTSGYTQMKKGWKELADHVHSQTPCKESDECVQEAVLSWCEEEKDLSLMMSRKLGVFVKSTTRTKDSTKADLKKLVKENYITSTISIKNAVSDIKIKAEFERRTVAMTIKIDPKMDVGSAARITWLVKQLENAKKKSETVFNKLEDKIWIEANIKFAQENLKVKLTELDTLAEISKGKEIQGFHIIVISSFGANFASVKKFIELLEQLILDYYEGIVQHMSNWTKPAPKFVEGE
ncbi:MAG: hypothetical protein ACJASM_002619 [Salibacteraceae bacterium]|jgi:hypothetical protein